MDKVFEDLLSMMKLASTMTPAQVDFSYKLKEYNKITNRELEIQGTSRGIVLTWKSATGVVIACPIRSEAFFFSEIGVLTNGCFVNLDMHFEKETEELLTVYAESKENQSLLKMLIPGITEHFKWSCTKHFALRGFAEGFFVVENAVIFPTFYL